MNAKVFKRWSNGLVSEDMDTRRYAQSCGYFFLNLTEKQHSNLYKLCFSYYPHDALTGAIIFDNGLQLLKPEA